jgi:hypothetical protein
VASGGAALYTWGVRKMRDRTLLPLSRAYEAADEVRQCKNARCRIVKRKRALGIRDSH